MVNAEDVCTRNYRIVGLSPANTVLIEVERKEHGATTHDVCDTLVSPAMWGFFGLTRAERGILRRGLTASGRARKAPQA